MMSLSNATRNKSGHVFFSLLFTILSCLSPVWAVAATHDVMVRNNFYSPNDLTIEVGDTVRWTNSSGFHDVTADDGSFASETSGGFTFSRTFMSAAEILYHCTVHSTAGRNINSNMNGRINVVAASTSSDINVESVDAANGAYKAGEDLRVAVSLRNTGNADSGMFNVSFYASTDSNVTSGDTLLGSVNISNIAAAASSNVDENVGLPGTLPLGDYFIGGIIDLDDGDLINNSNVDASPIFVYTVFTMNAGLNDAWFNPTTDGQGFFITVFPDLGFVSLAWFTYDTELPAMDATANLGDPGHRWLTALGAIDGDHSDMGISIASDGLFDTSTEIVRTEDGTITLRFNNCKEGLVSYIIPSISAQGEVPIERVATDNVGLCEALLREFHQ